MSFEVDIKGLRFFVAVAARKSFTLAAASLRVTQSAVTKRVLAIERGYGVRLFQRKGRQIALTEAGQMLYAHAIGLLQEIDATDTLLKQASSSPVGRLAIGAPIATSELILPAVIQKYRSKYPNVYIHVVTGYTGDLIEMLAEGRLDLALLFGHPAHATLDVQLLRSMDLGLLAPGRGVYDSIRGRSVLPFEEAAALPLVLPSSSHLMRQVLEQVAREHGMHLNVIIDCDSVSVLKTLVKTGVGYAFLSASGARQEIASGELRYITVTPRIEWSLSLAMRRTKAVSLAARMMARELIEQAKQLRQKS